MPKSFVAEQAYFLDSPPHAVFRALTEPSGLVTWFLSDARTTAKKGGSFEFDWIGGYHMSGVVLESSRDRSVSFRWTDPLPNGKLAKTVVAFRIVRKGKGTLLKLRHSGFRIPEHYAECSSRWAYYLTNLKSVLDHGTDLRSKFDW